jgi:hypothetical protein
MHAVSREEGHDKEQMSVCKYATDPSTVLS